MFYIAISLKHYKALKEPQKMLREIKAFFPILKAYGNITVVASANPGHSTAVLRPCGLQAGEGLQQLRLYHTPPRDCRSTQKCVLLEYEMGA